MKLTFEADTAAELFFQVEEAAKSYYKEKPTQEIQIKEVEKPKRGPAKIAKKAQVVPVVVQEVVHEDDKQLELPQQESPAPHKPELVIAVPVTKEELMAALQKLGAKAEGIQKVRAIFAQFGVARLSEVEPKKYHEMLAVVEKAL